MKRTILSLLRIAPVFDALVVLVLLILLGILWPLFGPRHLRLHVLVIGAAIGLVWVAVGTVRYLSARARLRQQPKGQLRGRLEIAMNALVERCRRAGTFAREDAAAALPWIVLIGGRKCGKSLALRRAEFRLIAECRGDAREDEAACTVWLSPVYAAPGKGRDGGHQVVVWEIAGQAMYEGTAGEEVLRWLAERRTRLDGVVFMTDAEDLASGDLDAARRSARLLSVSLARLGQLFPGRLPIQLVLSKCDRIDGFLPSFEGLHPDERRVWGIQMECRPEGPALQERCARLFAGLEGRVTTRLGEVQSPAEREEVLQFPREARRYGSLLCVFMEELGVQVQALHLREVFLCSSTSAAGAPILAPRRQQIPGPRTAGGGTRSDRPYFLDGAFHRIAQLAEGGRPAVRRQWLALMGFALLTIVVTGFMGHCAMIRWLAMDEVRASNEALAAQVDALYHLDNDHGDSLVPSLPTDERIERIRAFLRRDSAIERLLATSANPLRALGWERTQVDGFQDSVTRFRHCRTARRLLQPMLTFYGADQQDKRSQPLYDALARMKRGEDRASLLRGFQVLKAAALLDQRTSCTPPPGHLDWIADYFAELWIPKEDPARQDLRDRLRGFFADYLPPQGRRGYPRLRLDPKQFGDQDLAEFRARFGNHAGGQDTSPLVFTLMVAEALQREQRRGMFQSEQSPLHDETLVPYEFTAAGCREMAKFYRRDPKERTDQVSTQVAWLGCALNIPSPREPLEDEALMAYYARETRQAWLGWLGGLVALRPQDADGGVRLVAELGGQLDTLLRQIGIGEATGDKGPPPSEGLCRNALQSFAPFRQAAGAIDEGAEAGPPELAQSYRLYKEKLEEFRQQLAALSGSLAGATPKEPAALLLPIGTLSTLGERRRAFVETLKLRAPINVEGMNKALGWIEDGLWEVLLRSVQQGIAAQWRVVRDGWASQLPQAPGAPDPAGGAPSQALVRQSIVAFQSAYIQPFVLDLKACRPKGYGNGVASKRSVLCPEVCQRLRTTLARVSQEWKPPPTDAAPLLGAPPTLIASPSSRCAGSSVGRVRLDTGEFGKRYDCYLWQKGECRPVGSSDGKQAAIQLNWRDGGDTFDPPLSVSRPSFRKLVLDLLPRKGGAYQLPMEDDPRTGQQRVMLTFPVDRCRGEQRLKLYLDRPFVEALAQGPAKTETAPWLSGGALPDDLSSCPVEGRPEDVQ